MEEDLLVSRPLPQLLGPEFILIRLEASPAVPAQIVADLREAASRVG